MKMQWVLRILVLIMVIAAVEVAALRRSGVTPLAEEGVLSKLPEARSLLEKEKVALQKGIVAVRHVKVSRRRYKDVSVIGITGREIALAVLDGAGRFHVVRGLK